MPFLTSQPVKAYTDCNFGSDRWGASLTYLEMTEGNKTFNMHYCSFCLIGAFIKDSQRMCLSISGFKKQRGHSRGQCLST